MKEYFEIDQYNDTVESIAKKVESGLKFYDPSNQLPSGSYFHGYFHIDQIYPYRETDKQLLPLIKQFFSYLDPKAIIEIDDATDEDYPLVAIHFTTGDSYGIGYDNPRKEYFSVKLWVSRETRYEPEHSEWNDFSSYDYLYEACQHIGEQFVNDMMNRTAESLMEVVMDMADKLNEFDE